ncbi:hypothetical protein HPB48_011526 [Haemaphysalis longicornis]|uniref:Uncharacterized protein n=1 Tax=Haemaphysalis longicornis TaxID=44386 RepID=A0A9J6G546_HAELO|nr:hypothetical protein HPB48_011526 [Haemaphysalis longicornis]
MLLGSGFRYVLVGNFGEDPLEVTMFTSQLLRLLQIAFFFQRLFGIVRHVAGDGGQPTVQHFLFIYRMLSVNNLVRPPKRASVDSDGPQLLLKLQGLFEKEPPANSQLEHQLFFYLGTKENKGGNQLLVYVFFFQ